MKLKSLSIAVIIALVIFSNSFAEADKWTRKADMPTERGYLATSEIDGKIYAIGGMKFRDGGNMGQCVPVQVIEAYDPELDRWRAKTDMPTARSLLSSAVVNKQIYAIGGLGNSFNACPNVEVYDPFFDKWIKKVDMPTARLGFGIAVVKGRIYAIGGKTNSMGLSAYC